MINDSNRRKIHVDKKNPENLWTYKQGDNGLLLLDLFKNDLSFAPAGQSIRLGLVKRDKTILEIIEGIIVNGSKIDIKLPNSCFSIDGLVLCELEFTDDNGVLTTANFNFNVDKKLLTNDAVEATNEFQTFKKIEDDYKEVVNGYEAILESTRIKTGYLIGLSSLSTLIEQGEYVDVMTEEQFNSISDSPFKSTSGQRLRVELKNIVTTDDESHQGIIQYLTITVDHLETKNAFMYVRSGIKNAVIAMGMWCPIIGDRRIDYSTTDAFYRLQVQGQYVVSKVATEFVQLIDSPIDNFDSICDPYEFITGTLDIDKYLAEPNSTNAVVMITQTLTLSSYGRDYTKTFKRTFIENYTYTDVQWKDITVSVDEIRDKLDKPKQAYLLYDTYAGGVNYYHADMSISNNYQYLDTLAGENVGITLADTNVAGLRLTFVVYNGGSSKNFNIRSASGQPILTRKDGATIPLTMDVRTTYKVDLFCNYSNNSWLVDINKY